MQWVYCRARSYYRALEQLGVHIVATPSPALAYPSAVSLRYPPRTVFILSFGPRNRETEPGLNSGPLGDGRTRYPSCDLETSTRRALSMSLELLPPVRP
jgi:hypothetical protein